MGSRAEYYKQYRIDNADKTHARHKQYRIDNADKIKAQQNTDEAIEKRKSRQAKKITCECGCVVLKYKIKQHHNTEKHIERMKLII